MVVSRNQRSLYNNNVSFQSIDFEFIIPSHRKTLFYIPYGLQFVNVCDITINANVSRRIFEENRRKVSSIIRRGGGTGRPVATSPHRHLLF